MKTYLIITLSLIALAAHANTQEIDLNEGKIQATEANVRQDLFHEIESQEARALQLISLLGRMNNERFSSDLEKGESEDAYYAFLARFQSLKEDKSSLEMSANIQNLKNYSDRFDLLINDLRKFIR